MATSIQVHPATKDALERLKAGGQSYDDVIQALLEDREEHDPWLDEMEKRIEDVKSGRVKLLTEKEWVEHYRKRVTSGK